MKKEEELEKTGPTGLAIRPEWVMPETTGTENIEREDLTMPRIALAQALSPQVNPDDARYVEGLKVGDMFNTLTGEVYGRGPLTVQVLRADRPRGIEFWPMGSGGGVKDIDVPIDDPRMRFGPGGEPPAATKFYDFVIAILPGRELAVLSLKGTCIKVAKTLNGLIKIRNAPVWAGLYGISSGTEKNKQGTYAIFRVRNAGFAGRDDYEWAAALHASIKDAALRIEREVDVTDDDTPF